MQNIPRTYEDVSSPDSANRQVAMQSDMNALADDTYELTTLPESRKIVGSKWVYAAKFGQDCDEKLKARCVAKAILKYRILIIKLTASIVYLNANAN